MSKRLTSHDRGTHLFWCHAVGNVRPVQFGWRWIPTHPEAYPTFIQYGLVRLLEPAGIHEEWDHWRWVWMASLQRLNGSELFRTKSRSSSEIQVEQILWWRKLLKDWPQFLWCTQLELPHCQDRRQLGIPSEIASKSLGTKAQARPPPRILGGQSTHVTDQQRLAEPLLQNIAPGCHEVTPAPRQD